jgi:uncharacterized protein YjbI with pentapeptide repeats
LPPHAKAEFYAHLNRANLTNAHLTDASLTLANLNGASFCNTTMPDGSTNSSGC